MNTPVFSSTDRVFQGFMERQLDEGMKLAAASDIVRLAAAPAAPPHFLAEFRCKGLVLGADAEIEEADRFTVGIYFPDDYLRKRTSSFEILRLFSPAFHPNISSELPLICLGSLAPGTPLVDVLHRTYEVLSYQRWNPVESNALNRAACAWARANQDRFPLDRRPLRRRQMNLEVHPA